MLSVHAHYKFISQQKLHLILLMSDKGVICFKDQEIYKCNRSFKRALKDLHDKELVLIRQMNDGNEYKLTNMGQILGRILNEISK